MEFEDPLTGRKMSRLTNPDVLNHLPANHHRVLSRRGGFLLVAGEVSGSRQIHRYDLGRDRLTQLTVGPDIHPYSATLGPRDRTFFYLQANELREASARGGGDGLVYRSEEGWSPTGDLSVSTDGRYAALVETSGRQWRIRTVATERGDGGSVAVDAEQELSNPQFRPGRTDVLYSQAGALRVAPLRGGDSKPLELGDEAASIHNPYWSADGREVFFVAFPNETLRGATVRAASPDSGETRTVSRCSAFGWMSGNPDGSAIVGASRRPSGPNLYVLFVKLQRELTLCEHSSSGKAYPVAGTDRMDPDASSPSPVFSENSQWVYFTSDREGKPAIYRMKLEDLVEQT